MAEADTEVDRLIERGEGRLTEFFGQGIDGENDEEEDEGDTLGDEETKEQNLVVHGEETVVYAVCQGVRPWPGLKNFLYSN